MNIIIKYYIGDTLYFLDLDRGIVCKGKVMRVDIRINKMEKVKNKWFTVESEVIYSLKVDSSIYNIQEYEYKLFSTKEKLLKSL